MSKYCQTRWHLKGKGSLVRDVDTGESIVVLFTGGVDDDIRDRIVSDHNACLGIVDPTTTVPELVEAMAELVEDCAADMQQEFGTHENPHPTTAALDRAVAVLAKTGKA